jgi:hypothetical protein
MTTSFNKNIKVSLVWSGLIVNEKSPVDNGEVYAFMRFAIEVGLR